MSDRKPRARVTADFNQEDDSEKGAGLSFTPEHSEGGDDRKALRDGPSLATDEDRGKQLARLLEDARAHANYCSAPTIGTTNPDMVTRAALQTMARQAEHLYENLRTFIETDTPEGEG